MFAATSAPSCGARYCAGDVAGASEDRARTYRGVQKRIVAAAASYLDAHIVLDLARTGGIEFPVIYGLGAPEEFARRFRGTFEDHRYEAERLADLGAGTVLAVITETGRGKTSGVPVNRSLASLYTVIDGKIVRITQFPSDQAALDALKAAGLSE